MTIGTTIKKLRRERDMTQEQLAEYLNISSQAVSRWETDLAMPDITLLPKLANIFNITTDFLLGVDITKNRERINAILEQQAEYLQNGNTEASIELMRQAIKEFPNNFEIIHGLMHGLFFSHKPEFWDEVIRLGEKIIAECTIDWIRYSALQTLSYALSQIKNYEKAKEYALKLPTMATTSNAVLNAILKNEELLVHTQNNIMSSVDDIWLNVAWMLRAKKYSDEEKIRTYETTLKFYELLFNDGDFGFYNCRLADIFLNMAKVFSSMNNIEKVMENLELSAKHARMFDTLDDHMYTALLVNAVKYEKNKTSKNYMETYTQLILKALSWEGFDFYREDIRFRNLENSLKVPVK